LVSCLATAAVALAAVGAFLLWGPIGLGGGPLFVGAYDSIGAPDPGSSPIAIILNAYNSGRDPAVIDSISLIGRTGYPGPHVIALEAMSSRPYGEAPQGGCNGAGGAWPIRRAAHGFALVGCNSRALGPAIGHAFGFTRSVSPGYPIAAELSPPRTGGCWVLTDVVVHYHVGVRHYATTDPDDVSVCSGKVPNTAINAAMHAAENAEPR
jgi:hypothetical protein